MKLIYLFLSVNLLCSCSYSTKLLEKFHKKKKEKSQKAKVVRRVNYGPTSLAFDTTIFEDNTGRYGLTGERATNLYAVDFDNDGFTDLVTLPAHYSIPRFFKFSPEVKRFIKIKDPFAKVVHASFMYFADFDKDGVKDILVGVLNQKTEITRYPMRVFRGRLENSQIRYEERATALAAKILPTASVSVFDYNLDGFLDIFFGNWYDSSSGEHKPIPDYLYKGGPNFGFTDVSSLLEDEQYYKRSLKLHMNAAPTMGVSTCDVDQNGYPDILTASVSGFSNKLWMNVATEKELRTFKDYGSASGYAADNEGKAFKTGGGNSFFSSCSDYNNDGIIDIFLGELFHSFEPETRDRSSLLTGSTKSFPPKFIRTEYYMDDGTGQWDQGDRRAIWLDYNLDGLIDILVDNSGFPPKSRLVLFEQAKDHSYQDVSKKVGIDFVNPAGTVRIDLNRDGKWDLISGQTTIRDSKIPAKIFLFENRFKRQGRRSVRLFLRGQKGNLAALGAMVTLKGSEKNQMRWVEYSQGPFPSQNEEGLLFGLEKDEKLNSVKVRWPYAVKGKPLEKKYNLSSLKFSKHLDLTLCESGRFFAGRKSCKQVSRSNQ